MGINRFNPVQKATYLKKSNRVPEYPVQNRVKEERVLTTPKGEGHSKS